MPTHSTSGQKPGPIWSEGPTCLKPSATTKRYTAAARSTTSGTRLNSNDHDAGRRSSILTPCVRRTSAPLPACCSSVLPETAFSFIPKISRIIACRLSSRIPLFPKRCLCLVPVVRVLPRSRRREPPCYWPRRLQRLPPDSVGFGIHPVATPPSPALTGATLRLRWAGRRRARPFLPEQPLCLRPI